MNIYFSKFAQLVSLFFLLSFTISSNINIESPEWDISTSHSKISFEVNHFFTPVQGHFSDYTGILKFSESDLLGSYVKFLVKVASVKTENENRDNHLQSSDFFNVEKYPEMQFESKRIIKAKNGYIAAGEFTIKGVTKSIEVPFKILGVGNHPSKKDLSIIGIKSVFKINRNDYNVGTGDFIATTVIGDEVVITIVLEATRKK